MGLLNLEFRYGKTSVTHCLIQSDYTLGWPCEARRAVVLLANEAREQRESAWPLGVRRISGSLPRLPITITLFTTSSLLSMLYLVEILEVTVLVTSATLKNIMCDFWGTPSG